MEDASLSHGKEVWSHKFICLIGARVLKALPIVISSDPKVIASPQLKTSELVGLSTQFSPQAILS